MSENMNEGYQKFLEVEQEIETEVGRDKSPIFVDELNGKRYRNMRLGLVRNASEENKKDYKVYLDPAPHVVLDQNIKLRGWYKGKYEKKGVRPRPCFTDALLTQPYGGTCPVRCTFCYVNNGGRGYRGQGLTVVDPNYPQKIEKQIKRMKFGFPVYVSSFTEPFQKLENEYHISQQLGDIVTHYGLPIFYLTRQITPDWAVEHMLKNKYSYLQNSIITPDPKDYKKFSPNGASLEDMLHRMREISNLGIYISVQINPIVLGVVSDEQIIDLIILLKAHGANHVIFKFVELVTPAAKFLVKKYKRLFPGRGEKFESMFTEVIGGMRTINEAQRIKSLNMYKEVCEKVGVTMSLCYEYKYQRDSEGNIIDKTGVSMGLDFTTSEQCHGMKTPLHIKNSEGMFEPFEDCPFTGCLYCEEMCGEGTPPCGSVKLQKAPALGASDYNKPSNEL